MSDVVNLGVLSEIFSMEPANLSNLAKQLEQDFDEQDRMLILLYFRWLTRMGARDLGITHLEKSSSMTDATREWLKTQGLENVDDWEFMGMIDHGSTATNITCSHGGHRLRYAYYAHSPSTGKELVFGLGCGSEFFQVDLGLMKKLTKVVDTAKYELSCSFYQGRAHIQMAYSPATTMAQVMRHDAKIAELCYRYSGKTQIELWLNFINRGIMPPKTLELRVEQAYKMAVSDRLVGIPDSVRLMNVYNSLMTNELVYPGDDMQQNKGIVDKGEFIYPVSGETLFNTLRVCAIEELMQPSPIAVYHNVCDFFDMIDMLEASANGIVSESDKVSRASVVFDYFSGKSSAIKDTLSCLIHACVMNDARYVTLLLGLSPSSNSVLTEDWYDKCWKQSKFDYRLFIPRMSKRRLFLLLFIDYSERLLSSLNKVKESGSYTQVGITSEDVDPLKALFGDLEYEDDDEEFDDEVIEPEQVVSEPVTSVSVEGQDDFEDDDLADMFEDDDEDYDEYDDEESLTPASLSDLLMSGTPQQDED